LHKKHASSKFLLGAAAAGAVTGAVVAGPMMAVAGAVAAAYSVTRKGSILCAINKLTVSIECRAEGCKVYHRYSDGYCHLHRKLASMEAALTARAGGAFDASRFATVLQAVFRSMKARKFAKRLLMLSKFALHLATLPRSDPDPDSDEFYTIRTPIDVDKSKAGWQDTAIQQICAFRTENENLLNQFFEKLHNNHSSGFEIVDASSEVVKEGLVCVKHNFKTKEAILAKAERPGIKAVHPRFDVSHVRDAFRFKAVVYSFQDALNFMHAMDALLFSDGLIDKHVVKLDLEKLVSPKEFGWRFLAFDLRMLNGQLMECYIVFTGEQ
jgi:hypothetical protein